MRVGRERACADHIQCEVRADEAVMDVNAVLVCVFGPCCALCCSVCGFSCLQDFHYAHGQHL